jgi:hypothetical protein
MEVCAASLSLATAWSEVRETDKRIVGNESCKFTRFTDLYKLRGGHIQVVLLHPKTSILLERSAILPIARELSDVSGMAPTEFVVRQFAYPEVRYCQLRGHSNITSGCIR